MNQEGLDTLFVMAGEPSGDRAAASVIRQINKRGKYFSFGVGGDHLAGVGVSLLEHIGGLTAMGLFESLKRFKGWTDTWVRVREAVEQLKPRVALLVDSPEVNLPLARVLTEAGVKVVYYIGPQVWAWRENRLVLLRDRTDVVALILPFEKPLYDRACVRADFVGHPIMDSSVHGDRISVRRKLGIDIDQPLVAFLPGSRPGEMKRHAEPMIETVSMLKAEGILSVLVSFKGLEEIDLRERFASKGAIVASQELSAREVFRGANGAVIASGTATLEATVEGVPHVIIYRMDALSFEAGKLFVKTPFIGLPNLVAGKKIVPELIQSEVTSEALFKSIRELLSAKKHETIKAELSRVTNKLGGAGASKRVAELVLERSR